MIWITGDTHGDFSRLFGQAFLPAGYRPSRRDLLIVCGDFGGLWHDSPQERRSLDAFETLPYTVLFLDGNHENFDLFDRFPARRWRGGMARRIRPNLLHLVRGQYFALDGMSFFTMGGAESHDMEDGVLDPDEPDFERRYRMLLQTGGRFRVSDYNWWPRELPCEAELAAGWRALKRHGFAADYILTHCAPTMVQREIAARLNVPPYPENRLTAFLQRVYESCGYAHWLCGHYHAPLELENRFHVLGEAVLPLPALSDETALRP